MSTTSSTIAAATAAGVLAVGLAGSANAATGTPAADSGQSTTAATASSKATKEARRREMIRRANTLPGDRKLPLRNFDVGAGWGHSSGPHAGRNHKGLDLSARTGTPIYSVTDGTVAMARSYYGYGNLVIIKTPTGKRLLYAHQSRILVKKGKQVAAGEMIGRVGSTGYSTGPHLHFEVRTDKDRAFDPTKFLGVGKAQLQKRANLLDRLR